MRAWKKITPATVVATGIAFAALPGFAQMRTNYVFLNFGANPV